VILPAEIHKSQRPGASSGHMEIVVSKGRGSGAQAPCGILDDEQVLSVDPENSRDRLSRSLPGPLSGGDADQRGARK